MGLGLGRLKLILASWRNGVTSCTADRNSSRSSLVKTGSLGGRGFDVRLGKAKSLYKYQMRLKKAA